MAGGAILAQDRLMDPMQPIHQRNSRASGAMTSYADGQGSIGHGFVSGRQFLRKVRMAHAAGRGRLGRARFGRREDSSDETQEQDGCQNP
jgi:hypothetical protein